MLECDDCSNRFLMAYVTHKHPAYQRTALRAAGTWNISSQLSAYSVLAETEIDVQSTVAFAATNNLRLVVKNTGHDWFGGFLIAMCTLVR